MNYFVRYLNIKEIITESQKYTDVFKSVFKYSHTYKHANTYIRKHIRVGQNRSSIKNEFRFPCCCYCCFATVFDFAVTIFYKHSFLFQYPLSHLVLSFSEAIYKKQNTYPHTGRIPCDKNVPVSAMRNVLSVSFWLPCSWVKLSHYDCSGPGLKIVESHGSTVISQLDSIKDRNQQTSSANELGGQHFTVHSIRPDSMAVEIYLLPFYS